MKERVNIQFDLCWPLSSNSNNDVPGLVAMVQVTLSSPSLFPSTVCKASSRFLPISASSTVMLAGKLSIFIG